MLASSSAVAAAAAARSIVATSLFAISVLCAPTGCIAQVAQQAKQVAKAKESPEQKAVRQYLKENLPTGKFEEIKWWGPAKILANGKPGNTVVRLRYRATNEVGGMSVKDDVFEFAGKRVICHGNDTAINDNKERIFSR